MFSIRSLARNRGAALRALLGLIVLSGWLGAMAYAATRPALVDSRSAGAPAAPMSERGARTTGPRKAAARPPRPRIVRHPGKLETAADATFVIAPRQRGMRFQCRLDRGKRRACRSTVVYRGLAPGDHRFSVVAVSRSGRPSRAARFAWRLLEPKPFSIVQLPGMGDLYPGAPAVAVPLALTNPNEVPILVTDLRVSVSDDPAGCGAAENLELVPSSASSSAPIQVPAGGSVSLPTGGISPPAIRLRDLPVNQDACKNARFGLAFSGTASG